LLERDLTQVADSFDVDVIGILFDCLVVGTLSIDFIGDELVHALARSRSRHERSHCNMQ
jgi:hypothetical protein